MVVAMRGFLLALAVALFAPPSLAVTPPTCTNAGDTWGGGQLLSECSGNCEGEQLCVELFAEHYTCLNQTEPSTFVLLVRDAGYESDEDVAAQAVDSLYSVELSALPNDTDLYPHILNCYLYNVSALELAPLTTQLYVAIAPFIRAMRSDEKMLTMRMFLSGDGAFLLSNTFTESQFAFLQNLDTLNVTAADFNTQDVCQSNGTQLLRNAIQVCLASTDVAVAETPTASNHSAVIPGISGGLVAVLLIATLVRHRCRRIPGQFAAELDDPKLLLLLLKPAEIKDIKKIADGGHTVVWLVKYRKSQLLAAKRLRKDQAHVASHQHDVKAFVAEIKLAASLEHPNIVKLIGAAWTTKTAFQALFEYMNSGNVREYLALPSTPREWNAPKLQIAVGVAEALVYLHSFVPAVLHRDLNSSTVLLNSALQAKLIKAGVSQLRSADNVEKQQQAGRGPWQAPEVLAGAQDGDQAADIFSFGVLLSELDTHAIPYSDVGSIRNTIVLADAAILQLIAADSIRLLFGEGCPPDLRTLAGRCLAQDPRARPAAPEVAYALRALKKSLHW
ncbi:hypothetical protein BBJ28_00019968 [Nothophytophthora sp. Chile5]|nr:hypothetical protein BBJ28_00019968 [Nothophytophthora sp. Chile5]